ncbi:MAG TPA: hypothetical protein VFL93_03205, partial [Longimicrobiaceae bacterium]|nr:hypothetical protein [Longimicrobiaceae bacterium]
MPRPARVLSTALLLTCASSAAAQGSRAPEEIPLSWSEPAPGVWRAVVGTPDSMTLLGAAGGTPRLDGLAAMGSAAFPLPRAEVHAYRFD